MFKFGLYLSMFFFFLDSSFAAKSASVYLKQLDLLYRSNSSHSQIEMEVTTPNWSRVLKMLIWTKGLDYTFVRLTAPRKDKGVASLKRKNQMWNFFPKINKVIKIPSSMMMGSWMGSDFTNDDLVKNSTLVDDYLSQIIKADASIRVISLIPKKDTVSLWGRILIQIDTKTELPIKQEYFDEKLKLIRVMKFLDVKKMGGKLIPTTLELIPMTSSKKGHKTIVRYKTINFNATNSMSIFTRNNLQKRR